MATLEEQIRDILKQVEEERRLGDKRAEQFYNDAIKITKTTAKARAYLSADQLDLTHGTWQRVDLDAETYDPGGNFNNGLLGSGTADGTTAGHLIDSGYDFAAAGIAVGMRIKNTTDTTYTYITAVAVGDLTLRDDIFVSGELWEVQAARFVAPVAGYYFINYAISFVTGTVVADKRYAGRILINGSDTCMENYMHSSITDNLSVLNGSIIYLALDDFVEVWVKQSSGVNTVDIASNTALTFLSIHLLSV